MESSFAVAQAQPSFRSFSVGGVVGRTFSTWRRNLVPFALLAAIVNGPSFVVGLWNTYATFGEYPSFGRMATLGGPVAQQTGGAFGAWGPLFVVVWIATLILTFVQIGALTYGAIQHLAGREVTLGALFAVGLRRSFTVFVAGAGSGVLILLGTLLLVVPGVVVFCAVSAAIPAVVAEAKGPIDAIGRSFALTKGRRFGIFVAFLVMALVAWTAAALAGILPLALGGGIASLVGSVVAFVVTALATPLWTLLPAVAYHDLRVEKEGVDTAELARVFE